jgi:hypothetical protein
MTIFAPCAAESVRQPAAPKSAEGIQGDGTGKPPTDHDFSLPLVLLAAQKSVQADIKLTKTEKQAVDAIDGKMKKMASENMQGRPEAFMGKMESAVKDSEKELTSILTEAQIARLKQIALQIQGPAAMLVPSVADKLELTERQSERLKALSRTDDRKAKAILTAEQRTKWLEMTGRPFHGKLSLPDGTSL